MIRGLATAIGGVLILTLASCGNAWSTRAVVPPPAAEHYGLLQMNLCLSGFGACYPKVAYPAVVNEATTRIREERPDAVTFNEACRGDVARIARRTGYHLRFSRVLYRDKRLACVNPGGRGRFGDAVLTRGSVEHAKRRPFRAQAGIERRGWLCVTTTADVEVCTAHLATRGSDEVAANGSQCRELRALLARRGTDRTLIFGGDLNRRSSCAPDGFWTRTDRSAEQDPGLQHVYGTRTLRAPAAAVIPAAHTDHDVLLVRARLGARR